MHSLEGWVMLYHLAVRRINLGLADARTTLPTRIHRANCKDWWRRNNGLGLFFMVWARPPSSNDILDYLCFWLWQQIGEGPFLLQHNNALVHKARSIHKWFLEMGVEELYWPAQSPDLNAIQHLWDELELQLHARPNHPTSVPDLTNAHGWMEGSPQNMFQHLVESRPRGVEAVLAARGGGDSILMPMILEWDVRQAGVSILLVM